MSTSLAPSRMACWASKTLTSVGVAPSGKPDDGAHRDAAALEQIGAQLDVGGVDAHRGEAVLARLETQLGDLVLRGVRLEQRVVDRVRQAARRSGATPSVLARRSAPALSTGLSVLDEIVRRERGRGGRALRRRLLLQAEQHLAGDLLDDAVECLLVNRLHHASRQDSRVLRRRAYGLRRKRRSISMIFSTRRACRPPPNGVSSQVLTI